MDNDDSIIIDGDFGQKAAVFHLILRLMNILLRRWWLVIGVMFTFEFMWIFYLDNFLRETVNY